MRGGTGPVIGPHNSEASRLYLKLTSDKFGPLMPPTGALKPEHIAVVKAWIDQGAEWPDAVSGEAPAVPPDPAASRFIDALRAGNRTAALTVLGDAPAATRARGAGGVTPLMAAALYGDLETMRALLDGGADPNARNEAGATALMWAVSDPAKTQLLLERGAEADARSDDGRTPLMIASGIPGSRAVVKLLLDRGADPSRNGPSGFGLSNPLGEAAISGDAEVFRLLVERGANVKDAGPAALVFALTRGCDACAALLLKASPPPMLSIAAALLAPPIGDARHTRALIEMGADANARDFEGRPVLVAAAASDTLPIETVQLLLQRGADVHAKAPDGVTALDAARQRGQTPVVDLLVKAGATAGTPRSDVAVAPRPVNTPRAAVLRSLPLLQRTDATFLRKAGCVSCHNNTLTAMTLATARRKGLPVDAAIASQSVTTIAKFIESWRDRSLQNIGIPGDADTVSYILLGLAAEHYAPDAATDALAYFLKSKQLADGRWEILAHRPPIESSNVEVTAASMRALQVYAPRAQRAAYEAAIARAAAWLTTAALANTEDRAFQLFGLHWAGADRQALLAAARALVAEQRADGGWAQIPTLPSDAYATGQALAALAETGAMRVTDPAFQRGVQYPSEDAARRWVVVGEESGDSDSAAVRRRLPARPRFVDLSRGHQLGHARARVRRRELNVPRIVRLTRGAAT